jgi:hypothetical protein
VVLAVSLMASASFGRPATPKKANKYQATMVNGVEACTTANTTAPGALSTAACDPVVASDSLCQFGPEGKGSGKVQAKAKDDVAIAAKLGGVTATCEGETLCAVAGVRTSSNGCASTGDCSTITQPDLPLGIACCQVEKGKCKIKTTVNTALPGALSLGKATEIIVGEVGLARTGGGVAFRAGLFLP